MEPLVPTPEAHRPARPRSSLGQSRSSLQLLEQMSSVALPLLMAKQDWRVSVQSALA